MDKKSSEFSEETRPRTRVGSDPHAAAVLVANIIAIAGMLLVFDDDESEPGQEN
jgi:hypothetical protein